MRISDWSSDVCSSDLSSCCTGSRSRTLEIFLSCSRMKGSSNSADIDCWLLMKYGEIGRASCRERVCQYGVDLGSRRIIKKKTIEKAITTSVKRIGGP